MKEYKITRSGHFAKLCEISSKIANLSKHLKDVQYAMQFVKKQINVVAALCINKYSVFST